MERSRVSNTVLVLHPYGHLFDRDEYELEGLDRYFTHCMSIIADNRDYICVIIIPGGMMKQGVLEAENVAEEIRKRLNAAGITIPIILDPEPKSTISIIVRSVRRMSEEEYKGCILWQTADQWRWLKTIYLTWAIRRTTGQKFRFWVFRCNRRDLHPASSHLSQFGELLWIIFRGHRFVQEKIEADR